MSATQPWWASDESVAGLDEHEDPFQVHRSRRKAEAEDPPDWVGVAGDLAVSVIRRMSAGPNEDGLDHSHSPTVRDDVCRNCPVCGLMRALDRAGPDVAEHLGEAARNLALAASSFLEALAGRPGAPGAADPAASEPDS